MRARALLTIITAWAIGLASVCAFAEANYRVAEKPGSLLVTGAAANIDRLREYLEITDRGVTYTVLTGRATIHLQDGKIGSTQDLKDNTYLQIAGEQLSARTILAATVVVLDEKAVPASPQGYRPNDHIEMTGSVTGLAPSSREIDVHTGDGDFALVIRPETVIRRYIYVTDIGDINEGDDVSFVGRMANDGRIIAERIQVSAPGKAKAARGTSYRPTYLSSVSRGQEDSIEGSIVSPPSSFDRSILLATEYGERRVDVLKSAEVRIDRLPASVHDLNKGDHIRVFGTWDASTMIATRVETAAPSSSANYRVQELPMPEPAPAPEPPKPVEEPTPAPEPPVAAPAPPAAPPAPEPGQGNVLTGRIVDIDYTSIDLTVDAGLKDNKVDARDAAVTQQGSTRRFSELKKGDKVEVKGDWNGDVFKAVSIDVIE